MQQPINHSAGNAFVADTIWDLAAYKIYDIVFVPVMLMIRENRLSIPFPSDPSKPNRKLDIFTLKEDFTYWPAVVHNIFTAPYRELWYGPLCVEEVQVGKIHVVSTQIFKHVTNTHIRFAYSVKLLNLNTHVDIVLAEEELKPYVWRPPSLSRYLLSQDEIQRLRNASTDMLLYLFFFAMRTADQRAQSIRKIAAEEHIKPPQSISQDEFELESFLLGPEVIKNKDIVRVKVKADRKEDQSFRLMYFKVRSIVANRKTGEISLHGMRLNIKPVTEDDVKRDFSFMATVNDNLWSQYKDLAVYREESSKRMMCIFRILNDNIYQIKVDRILGRFYQNFPDLGLDAGIDIKEGVSH